MSDKKKKVTKEDILNAPTREEAEQLLEEYNTQNLIYNFFNFFIGGSNEADIKNRQTGKPGQPYY